MRLLGWLSCLSQTWSKQFNDYANQLLGQDRTQNICSVLCMNKFQIIITLRSAQLIIDHNLQISHKGTLITFIFLFSVNFLAICCMSSYYSTIRHRFDRSNVENLRAINRLNYYSQRNYKGKIQMEQKSPTKMKRTITFKKMEDILHNVESSKQEKKFNPGQVEISNTPLLHARLVNFFGDVRTEVFSIKVHQKQRIAAVGCSNGQVKVYDIYGGSVLKIGNTSRMSGFPTTSVCWKPQKIDDFVACNCDGTIKWYNKSQQTAYGHYQKNDISYLCCDYQRKEEWCIFGTDLNTLQIFDNETLKPIQIYGTGGPDELENNHHVNRIFSVKCLEKDPNVFFSGGWDSTVQIWDVRQSTGSVRKICGPSISSDSLDLKGNVLLAGNYQNNNIVQLYDFGSGHLIQTLEINEPHNSNSYCFAANFAHKSEKDLLAVALSGSNKVKILKDKALVCQIKFQAAPLTLQFYRMGEKDYLAVGGTEGTIYCFKLQFPK